MLTALLSLALATEPPATEPLATEPLAMEPLAMEPVAPEATLLLPWADAWIPDPGQRHPDGQLGRGALRRWVPMWTQRDPAAVEVLVDTVPVTLPAGRWRALVELWQESPAGTPLLTAHVHGPDGATTRTLYAEDFPNRLGGGMEPGLIPFELTAPGPVRIELVADRGVRVHVGAVQLAPDRPRPFYAIAHCANALPRVEHAMDVGLNGVELDVQWWYGELLVGHPIGSPPACWGAHALRADLAKLLDAVGEGLRAGRLAVVVLDIKGPQANTVAYARTLAEALQRAGVPGDRVVLSIPVGEAAEFVAAMTEAGVHPHLDAWHDLADGPLPTDWIDTSIAAGADFLGVGADPIVLTRPTPTWMAPLKQLVDRRDAGVGLGAAYFWTLDRPVSMRVALDAGVDGLIVNEPEKLMDVLRRAPYDSLFRMATGEDRIGGAW